MTARGYAHRRLARLPWLALGAAAACAVAQPSHTGLLLGGYLEMLVTEQVVAQARGLGGGADPAARAEVETAAQAWRAARLSMVRAGLDAEFGGAARGAFADFVARFTTAEQNADPVFLARTAADAGLQPAPAEYPELRAAALAAFLPVRLDEAGAWLGAVQTWVELRRTDPAAPPLVDWLAGAEAVAEESRAEADAPLSPLESLAAAEPELGAAADEGAAAETPLDAFDSMRSRRREKALWEAEAGMKQVAAERDAAEREYAQKKLAAAQADAEAVKHQAERLAGVEKEALDQRKHSWGNRLKSVVSAGVTAAGGAFFGGVGAEAGQQAANAIFQ
jgi:hypothetical protein